MTTNFAIRRVESKLFAMFLCAQIESCVTEIHDHQIFYGMTKSKCSQCFRWETLIGVLLLSNVSVLKFASAGVTERSSAKILAIWLLSFFLNDSPI